MSDSTNICLECGICCTGTLIGFVELQREELPRLREFMDIEEAHGNGFFLQPCNKYCDGCTVYSKRPKQCASFKCGLLKSVEQKELDFNTAVEIVNLAKEKRIAIEKNLETLQIELRSPSFYFKMVELKKWFLKNKEDSSQNQNYLELKTDLQQLDDLISNEFGVSVY